MNRKLNKTSLNVNQFETNEGINKGSFDPQTMTVQKTFYILSKSKDITARGARCLNGHLC